MLALGHHLQSENTKALGCRLGRAPSRNTKKGPATPLLFTINVETTATGHSSSPVLPITTSTPLRNWSNFECQRQTLSTLCENGSSIATSPHDRFFFVSNTVSDGTVIYPERKNPKSRVWLPPMASHSLPASGDCSIGPWSCAEWAG